MKDWIYDECNQVGVDYGQRENASVYDEQMERFRDYAGEARAFVDKLGALDSKNAVAADLGCGTGAFAIEAAGYFKTIYAADVSPEMLRIAKDKAASRGIGNVVFSRSGFLNFDPPEKVDVICTKWVLHHLPDYWKQAALLNMNKALKTGGLLLLTDFVFVFDPKLEENAQALIDDAARTFSADFVEEIKTHIREEFSTFDWILEGMIRRAGFRIERVDAKNPLASEYLCVKIARAGEEVSGE